MSTTVTFSNDVTRIFEDVETLAAAQTLTAADSGKTFILSAAAGATIVLPALKSGVHFKFIIGSAFATTDWIIDSAEGDNIEGLLIVNGASVVASGEDQINFVNSAETVGDHVEFACDGTNWYVTGAGNAAGSITATDPA
jgi:hypothetical protein